MKATVICTIAGTTTQHTYEAEHISVQMRRKKGPTIIKLSNEGVVTRTLLYRKAHFVDRDPDD